jgi:hypothetical protein
MIGLPDASFVSRQVTLTKTEMSSVTDTSVDHRQDRRSPFLLPPVAMFLATKIHPVFNTAFDLSLHATVNSKTEQEQ